MRLSLILLLAISLAAPSLTQAADKHLPTLKVGDEVYSKVTIKSVTATDIYFAHSRGIGNAKLKDLDPDMQKLFRFDPEKAAVKQVEKTEADALATKEAEEEALPPQPKPNGPAAEGDIGVRNSAGRSGSYYLPPGYKQKAVPLVVLMHGTDGAGSQMVHTLQALATERGFAIVAPDSRKAPNGQFSWQVGDQAGDVTEDLTHTMNCVRALQSMPGVRVDSQRTLIAGYSGGGSSAPYIASNESFFRAFAVLHGGIIPGSFGANRVRGWFSTGDSDSLRPVESVRKAMEQLNRDGWTSRLEVKTFSGGHELSEVELRAVIEWWLGK